MANEEAENEPGDVELPDPSGPGADPRVALGDEPVRRSAAVSPARTPGRSHGEASHSPGVVDTPDPQSEG